MKHSLILTTLILCMCGAASDAQRLPGNLTASPHKAPDGKQPAFRLFGQTPSLKSAKSTATMSRIIANASYVGNSGGTWQILDSSFYVYSNGRGSEGVPSIIINGMLANLRFDDGLNWSWDTSSHSFKPYEHVIHTFDPANNLLSELQQTWNGSAWVNSTRTTHLLNAAKLDTLQTIENWNTSSNAWVGSRRYHYTFDASDTVLLSDREETWQTSPAAWVNNTYTTYTLTVNGDVSTSLSQLWNTASNTWTNNSQDSYTYIAPHTVLSSTILNYDIASSSWKNQRRTLNYYNGLIQLTGTVHQSGSGTTWTNIDSLGIGSLTSWGDPFVSEYYNWSSGAWTHYYRLTYTYTASNKFASALNEVWNGSAYVIAGKYLASYDPSDRLIHEYSQSWSGSAWTTTSSDFMDSYYYETFDLGTAAVAAPLQATIYPVPAGNSIHIAIPASSGVHQVHLAVGNLQGALCFRRDEEVQGEYSESISIANLPTGTYYLLLSTDKGQWSKAFTVQR